MQLHRPVQGINSILIVTVAFFLFAACSEPNSASVSASFSSAGVERNHFGVTPSGDSVDLYTLTSESGMTMELTNYGGIITSLRAPGRNGMEDVVLGFDSLGGYLSDAYAASNPYFGALIGRYGNRIDEAV